MNVDHVCRNIWILNWLLNCRFNLERRHTPQFLEAKTFSEFKNTKQINAQWIGAQIVCTVWCCATSIGMLKQRIHFIWNLFMFEVFVWKSLRLNRRISNRTKSAKQNKKNQTICSNLWKKRAILRVTKWSHCNNKFDTINKSTYSSSFDSEDPKLTAQRAGK